MQGTGNELRGTRPKMIFREAIESDYDYMVENSINNKTDRKLQPIIDYEYTLEHEGDILGVGGFRMVTEVTAWCWVNFSEVGVHTTMTNLKETYRASRDWINAWALSHDMKRIQAFVEDSEEEIRLVRHLGFEQESIMKNFFGERDGLMYVRIF